MKSYKFALLFIGIIFSLSAAFHSTAGEIISSSNKIDDSGIRHIYFNYFDGITGNNIDINIFVIDNELNEINVIDTYQHVMDMGLEYSSYSLRELNVITPYYMLVNGGYTESRTMPIPYGLFVVKGEEKYQIRNDNQYRRNILCINQDNINILRLEEYTPGQCFNAIQTGPEIIRYKKNLWRGHFGQMSPRLIAGVDVNGKLFILYASNCDFREIANFLTEESIQKDVSCIHAISLGNSIQAGVLYKDLKNQDSVSELGNIDSCIATAISITPKKNIFDTPRILNFSIGR